MTDQADRLQAVAKALETKFKGRGAMPFEDCLIIAADFIAMSDADAAWREEQGNGATEPSASSQAAQDRPFREEAPGNSADGAPLPTPPPNERGGDPIGDECVMQFARAILHGDEAHRTWLLDSAKRWIIEGRVSLPPPLPREWESDIERVAVARLIARALKWLRSEAIPNVNQTQTDLIFDLTNTLERFALSPVPQPARSNLELLLDARDALAPFSATAGAFNAYKGDDIENKDTSYGFTIGAFRKAHAVWLTLQSALAGK